MTPQEKAAAIAAQARAKDAHEHWTVTNPGGRCFDLVCNPPQDQRWVLAHYPGCGVVAAD